ncbi:MAG: nucleoside hydrolase [Clostridiales bacterium]|nr:nucleoside hydrolase [Clostridiales bacterium]
MSDKRKKVILDTDPGVDDAIAMLMLMGSPDIDLLAIAAVGGNVGLASTLHNALCLTELAGRTDIPVYAGAEQPLLQRLETAEDIHGRRGLGPLELPAPTKRAEPGEVGELFYRLARQHPGEITLVAIGPLTNLGRAFLAHPDLPALLREVVIMGGAVVGGNATLQAEFNIYVDPEAARVVFDSGVKLTMFPLDICHRTMLGLPDIEGLARIGSHRAAAVAELLRHAYGVSTGRLGLQGTPVYDAVTAAFVIRPELFALRDFNVEIELRGARTRGRTVVDHYGFTRKPTNCAIPVESDTQGYLALLHELLRD